MAIQHNDPVFQDIPVLRNHPLLDDCVIGIVLLSCHKENSFRVPSGKEGIVGVAPVAGDNGSFRKREILCDGDLMDTPLRDMGKDGEIAVMVEEEVELDRPLRLPEGGPIKKRSAEIDDGGIQTEELILEAKLLCARDGPALLEKLIEQLLVELPGSFLIRVGQRGP